MIILTEMNIEVLILDPQVEVSELAYISEIKDVSPNSLLSIMYPQKEEFGNNLSEFCSKNNCVIYYPWS